jgi:hypothetical protein
MSFKAFNLMPKKDFCRVRGIQDVPDWAHMHNGAPQTGKFPESAHFVMNEKFPQGIKLGDIISNQEGLLLFSEKVVGFLESRKALKNNEVLPVGIVNHKGRREKAAYFVVHQVNRPKCVDEAQSDGFKSPINPDVYQSLKKLVLLESAIDPEVAIVRPAEGPEWPLFRDELAEAFKTEGFTGGIVEFFPLDAFDETARSNIRMGR